MLVTATDGLWDNLFEEQVLPAVLQDVLPAVLLGVLPAVLRMDGVATQPDGSMSTVTRWPAGRKDTNGRGSRGLEKAEITKMFCIGGTAVRSC